MTGKLDKIDESTLREIEEYVKEEKQRAIQSEIEAEYEKQRYYACLREAERRPLEICRICKKYPCEKCYAFAKASTIKERSELLRKIINCLKQKLYLFIHKNYDVLMEKPSEITINTLRTRIQKAKPYYEQCIKESESNPLSVCPYCTEYPCNLHYEVEALSQESHTFPKHSKVEQWFKLRSQIVECLKNRFNSYFYEGCLKLFNTEPTETTPIKYPKSIQCTLDDITTKTRNFKKGTVKKQTESTVQN